MKRALVAVMTVAACLAVWGASAPAAVAECWPITDGTRRVERPIVFTATVRDVTTEPDLALEAAGEGSGVLWKVTLDVGRDFGGNVPRTLRLNGGSLDSGVGSGCSWFLGDRVKAGDVLFVALDELIPFSTNTSLFGDLLLWRRVGEEWRFYETALQAGGTPAAYPVGARAAHATSEILAFVDSQGMPDTATVEPTAPQHAWEVLVLGAAVGAAAWTMRRRTPVH